MTGRNKKIITQTGNLRSSKRSGKENLNIIQSIFVIICLDFKM